MPAFFDSNVVLYSAGSDVRKADRSDALLKKGGWISVQVLNEVANISQRKMSHSWAQTHALLASVMRLVDVTDLTRDIHLQGLLLSERFRLSVYDGMIAAAALATGCDRLFSEDMHHGLLIDGRLRIENPFLA